MKSVEAELLYVGIIFDIVISVWRVVLVFKLQNRFAADNFLHIISTLSYME